MSGCNVSTGCTKALCECSHHDIDISRVHPPVLSHTPSCLPHRSNTVSLVKVEVNLQVKISSSGWCMITNT